MKMRERIILASDLTSLERVLGLIDELVPYIKCFEAGIKLETSVGLPQAIRALKEKRVEVFADVKLFDIQSHVAEAVKSLAKCGADIITISCFGGAEMLRAAVEAANTIRPRPLLIGVGPSTSQDYDDLVKIGVVPKLNIHDPDKLARAKSNLLRRLTQRLGLLAQESGLVGFVTPGDQIKAVRECCGSDFQIFTTGIRPNWAFPEDHKRPVTPYQAFKDSTDRIIIGRPIMDPPTKIGSRIAAVQKISREIEMALKERGY